MDLNYLYQRRQISQFNADNAACDKSRKSHQEMADAYGVLIGTSKNSPLVEPIAVGTHDAARDGGAAALVRARAALQRQSSDWLRPRPMAPVD